MNDNQKLARWSCYGCEAEACERLCRRGDGTHTFERLTRAYLAAQDDDGAVHQRHQAADCVAAMIQTAPHSAVGFLVVACQTAAGPAELALLAAGPLEDLLEAHGPDVIAELVRIAKVDPKFRLMLSGTWGRERIEAGVWSQLVRIVCEGPVLDDDERTPAAGLTGKIATRGDLAALFPTKPLRLH